MVFAIVLFLKSRDSPPWMEGEAEGWESQKQYSLYHFQSLTKLGILLDLIR